MTDGQAELRQPLRLVAAFMYLGALLLLARVLNGTFLPPFGIEGLWFYAAFAALLMGELILEPFFTRPADALVNGIALLLVTASTTLSEGPITPLVARIGRLVLFLYALLIIIGSVVAIVLKDRSGSSGKISARAASLVGRFGRARWVFSTLLFAVGYAAFVQSAAKVALLYLAWFAVLVLNPAENLLSWLSRRRPAREKVFHGEVVGIEDPSLILARLKKRESADLGQRVRIGESGVGTIVDSTVLAEEAIVRILPDELAPTPLGTAIRVLEERTDEPLVGHVSPGTHLEEVKIDSPAAAAAFGLVEGRLVAVQIEGKRTLYQVTSAAIVRTSDEDVGRQVIRVGARKLGTWNDLSSNFDPVPWLPQPGQEVRLVASAAAQFDPRCIGHIPQTSYGISVDIHAAVTHNSAILGILGIGKTHLAWELIARMLVGGIQVVVLDITDKHAPHFRDVFPLEAQRRVEDALNRSVVANLENRTVRNDEAGNRLEFVEQIRALVDEFVGQEQRLLILNPNRLEVSRMEGRPFQGQANMLSRLTMVEVTRIITEALLEKLQESSASEKVETAEGAKLCLVLEEGHSLVPEWNSVSHEGERLAVNGTTRAILQGRKYGFGTLLITQRTANVTKSILNQCNTVFGLRVYDATGMGFLENYIGPAHAAILASLQDRQAVVFGRASSCRTPIIVEVNDAEEFRQGYWSKERGDVPTVKGAGRDLEGADPGTDAKNGQPTP
jgi:hypothetical protein